MRLEILSLETLNWIRNFFWLNAKHNSKNLHVWLHSCNFMDFFQDLAKRISITKWSSVDYLPSPISIRIKTLQLSEFVD